MKKIKWLYFVILIALVASCNKTDQNKPETDGPTNLTVDSTRTFISLAQLVLDTLIEAEGPALLEETGNGNLKKIWKYDEQLYLESNKSKKFIVTKEINPCCPCSSTEVGCCMCLIETEFAAVSDMQARATLDGADMKTTSNISGVDVFAIPKDSVGTFVLKISGRSIPSVSYRVTVANGTISFN
jgi:hypothetical protein